MFKSNPDLMRMAPTPERVLAMCRLIAQNPISEKDLREAMSLSTVDIDAETIRRTLAVAQDELGIITNKDGLLTLTIDDSIISTAAAFRRFISSQVFYKKDTTFYLFTKWLISKNEGIFSLKSWEVIAKTCGSEQTELKSLNENAVLGWRFWAAFLGLGYLSGSAIIPNMKLRIEDVLITEFDKKFKRNEAIIASEFMAWLYGKLPEVEVSGTLPLALSAGLRTLHELKVIELSTWQDSDKVMLHYVDGELINNFSHIIVKGGNTK